MHRPGNIPGPGSELNVELQLAVDPLVCEQIGIAISLPFDVDDLELERGRRQKPLGFCKVKLQILRELRRIHQSRRSRITLHSLMFTLAW